MNRQMVYLYIICILYPCILPGLKIVKIRFRRVLLEASQSLGDGGSNVLHGDLSWWCCHGEWVELNIKSDRLKVP